MKNLCYMHSNDADCPIHRVYRSLRHPSLWFMFSGLSVNQKTWVKSNAYFPKKYLLYNLNREFNIWNIPFFRERSKWPNCWFVERNIAELILTYSIYRISVCVPKSCVIFRSLITTLCCNLKYNISINCVQLLICSIDVKLQTAERERERFLLGMSLSISMHRCWIPSVYN